MTAETGNWVAGVDGCRAGWIAVIRTVSDASSARAIVVERFSDLLTLTPELCVIAVDMPIGLPDRTLPGGRGPESCIRPFLGERQSSVFSIPSRSAVYAEDYRKSCELALLTSDPPRKVSKQAFNIFPKIRELDEALTPQLAKRVFEVHPEFAFWRLNGGKAMSLPKKIKGTANPAGMEERREVLKRYGFDADFLNAKPPSGAAADDYLDASVNSEIAARLLRGTAEPFPRDYSCDSKGLPMAIWA